MTTPRRGRMVGFDRFPHVTAEWFGSPWALELNKWRQIDSIVRKRIESGTGWDNYTAARGDSRVGPPETFQRVGDSVAVVYVRGVVTHRPSLFASGGTSTTEITRALDAALADPTIKSILLNVDSPGGSVAGIPELADRIHAARREKPIVALADTMAASAAYWLASQANELIAAPSGSVGSIGVIAAHVDESRAEELAGLKTTLITAGKYKAELDPSRPLSPEAHGAVQDSVDKFYSMFVRAVARGRGVPTTRVDAGFGQGRMVLAADALTAGMADRVATVETVLGEMLGGRRPRQDRGTVLRGLAARAVAAGISTPTATDPAEARRQFDRALAAKQAADGVQTDSRGQTGRAAELRRIAADAAVAGVAVPTSTDPALAREQLARSVAAKLVADDLRATPPAPPPPRRRARASTRAERVAACRRVAEGLSTQP